MAYSFDVMNRSDLETTSSPKIVDNASPTSLSFWTMDQVLGLDVSWISALESAHSEGSAGKILCPFSPGI